MRFFKKVLTIMGLSVLVASCGTLYRALPERDAILDNPVDYPSNNQVQAPVVPVKSVYKVALFLPTQSKNAGLKQVATDLLGAAYLAKQDLNNSRLELFSK
jgi:hypothetical protein